VSTYKCYVGSLSEIRTAVRGWEKAILFTLLESVLRIPTTEVFSVVANPYRGRAGPTGATILRVARDSPRAWSGPVPDSDLETGADRIARLRDKIEAFARPRGSMEGSIGAGVLASILTSLNRNRHGL
jgi:hypothetical protein